MQTLCKYYGNTMEILWQYEQIIYRCDAKNNDILCKDFETTMKLLWKSYANTNQTIRKYEETNMNILCNYDSNIMNKQCK